MRITIDCTLEEAIELEDSNEGFRNPIPIIVGTRKKVFLVQSFSQRSCENLLGRFGGGYATLELVEIPVPKTPQELKAEEAVKAAEESLKKARETLEACKK